MIFNAVIFDIDDTLYDYELCHKAALKAVSIYINDSNFEKAYLSVTKQYKLEVGNIASSHNRFIYFKWIKEYLKSDFSGDISQLGNIKNVYIFSIYRNI